MFVYSIMEYHEFLHCSFVIFINLKELRNTPSRDTRLILWRLEIDFQNDIMTKYVPLKPYSKGGYHGTCTYPDNKDALLKPVSFMFNLWFITLLGTKYK